MAVLVAPEMWFLQGPATDVEANKLRTSAAAFRRMLDASLGYRQGVVYTRGTCTDLKALATGTPDGFIHVQQGSCYVRGTQAASQGMYHLYNDATLDINVLGPNPAHATLDRIDLVVARYQDQFYSGSLDLPTIEMVTGTPSGSPAVPAAPANSLILAQLSIIHASSTIPQSVITDRRVPAGNGIVVLDDILVGTDARYPTQVSATQIDFLNAAGVGTNLLPTGLSDLEIILYARGNQAAVGDNIFVRLNNDSGANYYQQQISGIAAAAAASETLATASAVVAGLVANSAPANRFSGARIHIPDYMGGQKKVIQGTSYSPTGTTTGTEQKLERGAVWDSTAPITRISLLMVGSTQFMVGSRFILLGHAGLQP